MKPPLKKFNPNRHIKSGLFKCKNPHKYIGDCKNIIYRSGLEFLFFRYCDYTKSIKKWGSEITSISYFDPTTNKQRKYYPDIYMEYVNNENKIVKSLIEIKPKIQTLPPNKRGPNYQKRLNEYNKNISKWEAAKHYASNRNMTFKILTEQEIR